MTNENQSATNAVQFLTELSELLKKYDGEFWTEENTKMHVALNNEVVFTNEVEISHEAISEHINNKKDWVVVFFGAKTRFVSGKLNPVQSFIIQNATKYEAEKAAKDRYEKTNFVSWTVTEMNEKNLLKI